jgi:hypothetical protein
MDAPSRALVMMAKPAEPGRAKTRLTTELSPERAADLYAAFSADVATTVAAAARRCHARPVLAWDGPPDPPDWASAFEVVAQSGADLGARIESARVAAGADLVVIVGSDAPLMNGDRIGAAFDALRGGRPVFGPVDDGGYDLVGLLGPSAWATSDIPWSTADVMAVTRRRAAAAGIAWTELEREYDVDTPDDLRRLARDPRLVGAPRSYAALTRLGWEIGPG